MGGTLAVKRALIQNTIILLQFERLTAESVPLPWPRCVIEINQGICFISPVRLLRKQELKCGKREKESTSLCYPVNRLH